MLATYRRPAAVLHQRVEAEDRGVPGGVVRDALERVEAHEVERVEPLEQPGRPDGLEVEVSRGATALADRRAGGLQQVRLARPGPPPQPQQARRRTPPRAARAPRGSARRRSCRSGRCRRGAPRAAAAARAAQPAAAARARDHVRRTPGIHQHVVDAAHRGREQHQRAERRDRGRAGPAVGRGRHDREAEDDLAQRVELAGRGGRAAHRPEQLPVRECAEHDHEVAQDHERGEPPRHETRDAQAHEHRDQQQLVGERVEHLAEFAGPAEALGEEAVERVGERRQREEAHDRRETGPAGSTYATG